jgi:capsule polysaccharide modification protein KpsS
MIERKIDAVFLFGDQRPIHQPAVKLARELGIAIWVFEEGYLRPDYVTVERNGVNGNSEMSRDPEYYLSRAATLPEPPPVTPIGNTIGLHTTWTIANAVAKTFFWFRYPRYKHHRQVNAFWCAYVYSRGVLRTLYYRRAERGVVERVIERNAGRYFVLPLQVYCDAQLQHSDFPTMESMIEHVVETFSKAAPADATLVVKHHPHDQPFRDYTKLLRKLAQQHGLGDRVVYIHDTHLPTLLKNARGVVTMNSTVGPSALFHNTPVKVLGRAIYDVAGLTFQASLESFFNDPGVVDTTLLVAFTNWLRVANQVNGSFYRRHNPATASGLPASIFDRVGSATASAALPSVRTDADEEIAQAPREPEAILR